ncbi:MAG: GTP-binding protein [Candidatus Lokiarchaeota archaeon]|nr:GTP-binding protein [Candidatus Harpocratesius repetitus]
MDKKAIKKIILAGDGGVGKSSFLATKTKGKFSYSSKITIGIDFSCVLVENARHPISFLVYDLGGQQRFHFLHDAYLKGTKGGIILYDITRPKTFENISHWVELLMSENEEIPIILAGSKIDLAQPEDLIYYQKLWKKMEYSFPHYSNIVAHLFISSKQNIGIDEVFSTLKKYYPSTRNCVIN